MKYKFVLNLIFYTLCLYLSVCIRENLSNLPAGYPDRTPGLDVLPGFKNPPKGYGEVSLYWWIGDTLTKDRIIWQLDQLQDKNITGLQINYCHTEKESSSS
jgi:hypothetical protein